jgi:formylmethanofuran dehydrogenase subunit E
MVEMKPIGVVKNKFNTKTDLNDIRQNESIIVIDKDYEEGLFQIDGIGYLQIIFNFHLSKNQQLKGPIYNGKVKGVFASRSPKRPNGIGITTVQLIERKGRKLRVKGLDALNGTPVLDIKPYTPFLDENKQIEFIENNKKLNPRSDIHKWILRENYQHLLLNAGELHGHYCPGLSLGVLAGSYALKTKNFFSDGMEKVIAIVETNNCFSDGIQYATGCTFGNNSLIFRDFGKTAVTVSKRDGNGLRISVKNNANNLWQKNHPEAEDLFQKVVTERKGNDEDTRNLMNLFKQISFEIIEFNINDLFNIKNVKIKIPDYAPIHENILCSNCKENIMGSRVIHKESKNLCIPCSKSEFFELDGSGIKKHSSID